MTRNIRTYTLTERAMSSDFGIHDERRVTRIGEAHRHEYFQIQLNVTGRGVHHIGAVERAIGRGSLTFVSPYRVHRVVHSPGSRFFVINFHLRFLRPELDIDPLDMGDLAPSRTPELAPFLFQEYADFRLSGAALRDAVAACEDMVRENANRDFCSLPVIRSRLTLLLAAVCRAHAPELAVLEARHARQQGRRDTLGRVTRYVRENLARRITLAGAAAAAALSPHYLAHFLKKETGRTFLELVTEKRMEAARELLLHTELRVHEVAARAGFEDDAYFARRFRQLYGQTPSAYRAQRPLRARQHKSPEK